MKQNPLWLFVNIYGWLIFAMSVITAFIVDAWWVVLFGVVGYLFVLVVELMWGGALGRTGRIRLARAEQENRELRDEKARLVGTIEELMGAAGLVEETPTAAPAEAPAGEPEPPSTPGGSDA